MGLVIVDGQKEIKEQAKEIYYTGFDDGRSHGIEEAIRFLITSGYTQSAETITAHYSGELNER